VSLVYLITFV